jgi:hypothetical protein
MIRGSRIEGSVLLEVRELKVAEVEFEKLVTESVNPPTSFNCRI